MCLLDEIEVVLLRTGISATRFGRKAVGDPRFVFDLRNGREPGPRVARRVTAFIAREGGC